MINGMGSVESKIYLIGEGASNQDKIAGKPIQGGPGQVLDRLLRRAGIDRDKCYIDSIDNIAVVKGLIEQNRPNVIGIMGEGALNIFLQQKQILKWRGSILNYSGIKIIPLLDPLKVMREPTLDPIASMDMVKLVGESKSHLFTTIYNDNFIINPSFEEVINYLTSILPSKAYLTFDIETIPDMEQIMCIGFAWSKQDAICIPIFFGETSWWTVEEELAIIKALRNLFLNPGVKFIAQNAQYDMTYIRVKWGIKCQLWMDTMIAFHTVYPEMKKSLAFLTSIYTSRPYYKDDGGQGKTPEQEWLYNCKDVVATYEIAFEIRKELEEFKTLAFYEEHSNKLIEPLLEMQIKGILIDVKRRDEVDKELSKKRDELQARLNLAVGREVNVNSPKQIKELLYDDLGLPPIYSWGKVKGKKAKVMSSNEEAIVQLQKMCKNPVLDIILEIRGIVKQLGTYVRAKLEVDNRLCCSYKITGTSTGRLSSSKSVFNRGTNLQNIPRDPVMRSMFIADSGKILVNADLSQAEARIVAYVAEETRLIRVFENGDDIHAFNAAIIFNVHPNEVTPTQRQTAKARVHGANYGIGPAKAAKLAGTTEAKAREDLNKYKSSYPNLELWWKTVEAQLRYNRTLKNLFGRKRTFFGHWSDELLRTAIAYVPQSTVGDLLNYGIIRSYPNLPNEWDMLAQNHDSILIQVPEETPSMHLHKFFKHYYEIPLEIHNRKFIIPVDIKVGYSWGEMKDLQV